MDKKISKTEIPSPLFGSSKFLERNAKIQFFSCNTNILDYQQEIMLNYCFILRTLRSAWGIKKPHTDGHMQMYDGKQWVSDFKQPNNEKAAGRGNGFWAGSDLRDKELNYIIYRK